jgi:hypothetical protein
MLLESEQAIALVAFQFALTGYDPLMSVAPSCNESFSRLLVPSRPQHDIFFFINMIVLTHHSVSTIKFPGWIL